MLKFRCANCKQKIGVPEEYAGKRVRCPRCKQAATVPSADELAAQARQEAATSNASTQPAGPATARAPAPIATQPAIAPLPAAPEPPSPAPAEQVIGPSASQPVVVAPPAPDLAAIFAQYMPAGADPAHASIDDLWHDRLPSGADQPTAAESPVEQSEPLNLSQTMEAVEAPAPQEAQLPVNAEIMDAPAARPSRPPPTSDEELNDLLRDLGEPDFTAEAPPYPPDTVANLEEEPPSSVAAPEQSVPAPAAGELSYGKERPAGASAALLGIGGIVLGLAAVAMCWLTRWDRYAVPVGTAGLVLSLAGVAIAVFRRSAGLALPVVGAFVAAVGIAVPVLGAYGIIPLPGRVHTRALSATPVVNVSLPSPDANASQAAQPIPVDGYIRATSPIIAGEVEVRVSSVRIVQPVVHDGHWNGLHSLSEKRLLISLLLKDVAPAGQAAYRTWAGPRDGEQAMLTDAAGTALKQIDTTPLVPVGRVPENPATLYAGRSAVPDVLVFERPADSSHDLKLELPGANIGLPATTLRIGIPAEMIQQ